MCVRYVCGVCAVCVRCVCVCVCVCDCHPCTVYGIALAGGDLSSQLTVDIRGHSFIMANILQPLFMEATEENLRWFVTQLYHDMQSTVTDCNELPCALDEDALHVLSGDESDDEETIDWKNLICHEKESRDIIRANFAIP